MNDSSTTPAPDGPALRDAAADIDASCRGPVLVLVTAAVPWLGLGLLLALLGAIKLHAPGFLADCAACTVGRLRPAAMNCLLYGFASQAGLAVLLWMMARLGGTRLSFQGPIIVAAGVWNLGVLFGVVGILLGDSTGFEWLEMPRYASPILFLAQALIGIYAMANFWMRRVRPLYVSQWYLLAALFWFPWLYSAANLLLVFQPVRGVLQAVVNGWFSAGLLGLWLGAIGLAVIYYFIPKLTGRPLYSQSLAALGFWTGAVFTGWTGSASLVGGPIPLWMASVQTASGVAMLLPLLCAAINWRLTLHGARVEPSPTLPFVLFAAAAYLVAGGLGVVLSLQPLAVVFGLTMVPLARVNLALLGFVGMALLGAIYHILPRVSGVPWPSPGRIKVHFFVTGGGVVLLTCGLLVGGVIQGGRLNDPAVAFVDLARSMVPFIGLSTLGWALLLIGHVFFALNLSGLLWRWAAPLRAEVRALVRSGVPVKAEVSS
ncbi:MAG TPA: cbb3-type cytochrome c oxidase subunit I [Methylomirabilota bacterium]|nr:cbb3-type cytochrome c oxidase subunit I [Methylomirabilota bacterium]